MAHADPNLVVGEGISPLQKVIAFARAQDAASMRDLLLLQHGAAESKIDGTQKHERQAAGACEAAWHQNFNESAPNNNTYMPSYIQ